jgi:hypothetical protein
MQMVWLELEPQFQREFLDVHGTAKVTGLVTARNLAVTGVSTFYSDVKIGSAVTVYASTGIVSATAFYGDGSKMTGVQQVAVDGWIVNAGNISTTSNVGIGTDIPNYSLQVGIDPLIGNGLSVDALTGNVNTTGIITAIKFSGPGDGVTDLNASVITSGTLDNDRLPQDISVSGILTAYSFTGFGTNLQGLNATNITNGTLNNSRLPQSISISGIITASSGIITSLTSINLNNTGIATLGITSISNLTVGGVTTSLQGFVGDLTGTASTALSLSGTPDITVGNIDSVGIATLGNVISLNINNAGIATLGNVNSLLVSGVTTSLQGFVGDLTGTASTALSLSGTPDITVGNIDSVGIATLGNVISLNINNAGIATLGITSISNLTVGGVTTSLQGFVGDLTGTASTALSLSGTPDITVGNINNTGIITSVFSSIGISTVSTRLYAESIGVGTNSPSSDIHIRRSGQSVLQITSDTAEAIISVGRSTTLIGSNGALIFGNTAGIYPYSDERSLDIVNYDTGSLNHYLHYGISGVGTGNFNWIIWTISNQSFDDFNLWGKSWTWSH